MPCSPLHTVPEALAHPHVQALGMLTPVPGAGVALTGLPLRIDAQRPPVRALAPRLGEHNARHAIPSLALPVDHPHREETP